MRIALRCQGRRHHVLWKRGAIVLEDHDAGADAIVVALGGDPPPCLELLRSWRLGYVEIDTPRVTRTALVRSLSSLARWMSSTGAHPVVLPEPLRRLREASILHTWGRGLREDRARDASQQAFLERAIVRRVRDVARLHVPKASITVDVLVVDDPPFAEAVGATMRIGVRSTWLTRVWVPGLESRGGGLVLDATTEGALDVARWTPDGEGAWEIVVSREASGR
ncbi:MAG TPA: hypothetical protein VM143_10630 [Acidimicrobiales bacterium]|nr:hypothetical protein [Acidimicrobiales bacterium]